MGHQSSREVQTEFIQNFTRGTNEEDLHSFGDLDLAASLHSNLGNTDLLIQKLIIASMVLTNFIATSFVLKLRLVINCFHQIVQCKRSIVQTAMIVIFTLLQMFSLSITGYIFNALLLALDISTSSVDLLNNSLAVLILDQLEMIGSAFIFSFFRSKYYNLSSKSNFMVIKCQG